MTISLGRAAVSELTRSSVYEKVEEKEKRQQKEKKKEKKNKNRKESGPSFSQSPGRIDSARKGSFRIDNGDTRRRIESAKNRYVYY